MDDMHVEEKQGHVDEREDIGIEVGGSFHHQIRHRISILAGAMAGNHSPNLKENIFGLNINLDNNFT